jgi:hypothetical protein
MWHTRQAPRTGHATAARTRRRASMARRAGGLLAAVVVAGMTLLTPASVVAAAARDQLPDLRMLKPRDVRVVRYASGPFRGHRLLRFSTLISNEGVGPLELRGQRSCTSLTHCPTMTVRQRIRQSDGSWRSIPTTATMQYAVGDGHHHWHAVGFERYRLWALGVEDPAPLRAAKYGFCFFDTTRWLSGSSPTAHYVSRPTGTNPGCGDPKSLKTRVGLTPGWADIYPWDFSGQYIDVTGVPAGEYPLCVGADPAKRFLQASTTNDEAWVRLRIAGTKLTIRQTKRTSCSRERARYAPESSIAGGLTDRFDDDASSALTAVGTVSFASAAASTPTFLCRLPV